MFRDKQFVTSGSRFCEYLTMVNFISFNFGFHVHEKAIFMAYLPLVLARGNDRMVRLLGLVGTWSLFPLIPPTFGAETLAKHLVLGA